MAEMHERASRIQEVLFLEPDQAQFPRGIGRVLDTMHEIRARAGRVHRRIHPEAQDEQHTLASTLANAARPRWGRATTHTMSAAAAISIVGPAGSSS